MLSVLSETHGVFAKFISGKIIDSLIVGVLTFIIMNIAGIPYTILISVLIGVTNIIPFLASTSVLFRVRCWFLLQVRAKVFCS